MEWRVEFSSFNGMMRWNVVGCEFWQNKNRRACANWTWTLLVHVHFVLELRINIFCSHCNPMCAMYEQWGGATHCLQVCSENAGGPRWCWLRTCLGGIQWKDFWWFPNSSTHQIDLVWIKVATFCWKDTCPMCWCSFCYLHVCQSNLSVWIYVSYVLLFLICLRFCMVSVIRMVRLWKKRIVWPLFWKFLKKLSQPIALVKVFWKEKNDCWHVWHDVMYNCMKNWSSKRHLFFPQLFPSMSVEPPYAPKKCVHELGNPSKHIFVSTLLRP